VDGGPVALRLYGRDSTAASDFSSVTASLMHEKILLVDDNPRIRKDIVCFLRTQGYDISEASNGHEAIHLLENEEFKLIVSDILMSKLDGFGVLKHVQAAVPKIPVLLMSGVAGIEASQAIELGAIDFIRKPFDLRDLLSEIRLALLAAKP
jgi:DNA-binding NtrC family response regulator